MDMKQILLRKVPENLHREVKAAAAHGGMSMEDFIVEVLSNAVSPGQKMETAPVH